MLIHHDATDHKSELKVAGKYIQYIAQVHMKNIVKQMAIKYGEFIRQFNLKYKVYANVRYEKHPEFETTSNHGNLIVIDKLLFSSHLCV